METHHVKLGIRLYGGDSAYSNSLGIRGFNFQAMYSMHVCYKQGIEFAPCALPN